MEFKGINQRTRVGFKRAIKVELMELTVYTAWWGSKSPPLEKEGERGFVMIRGYHD